MKSVFPEEKPTPDSPAQEKVIITPVDNPPQLTQYITDVTSPLPAETAVESEKLSVEQNTEILKPNYTVTIRFLEDTSIELTRDDGETIAEEFKAGDVQSWSADSSLTMIFSQPNSAEILVNNSALTFPEIQHGAYTLQIPHDIAELQPDE